MGRILINDISKTINEIDPKITYNIQCYMYFLWDVIGAISINLCILSNLIILFDLYYLLRNPFVPRKKRNRCYNILNLIFVLITFIIVCIDDFNSNELKSENVTNQKRTYNDIMGFVCCFVCLISIWPIIEVFRRISQKGTSKEVRKIIFKRHFYFSIVFIAILI